MHLARKLPAPQRTTRTRTRYHPSHFLPQGPLPQVSLRPSPSNRSRQLVITSFRSLLSPPRIAPPKPAHTLLRKIPEERSTPQQPPSGLKPTLSPSYTLRTLLSISGPHASDLIPSNPTQFPPPLHLNGGQTRSLSQQLVSAQRPRPHQLDTQDPRRARSTASDRIQRPPESGAC